MDHLERLWIEILQDTDLDQSEVVFKDVIAAGDSHHLWNSSTDDTLRRVISSINSKLNDGKTREYGMVTLSRFIEQIDPARFVAIHEGLASSLHLSLKCLEVDTTHQFLAKILVHCRSVPELGQLVTSTIVPKILSSFCDANRKPTNAELKLLRICLQRYHGPCGNQRTNLERALLAMFDSSEDDNQLELICAVIPLLSSSGGGGANGIKHSEDWNHMFLKVLATLEDSLTAVLGDACPMLNTDTLFEAEAARLSLSVYKERNVFQRLTTEKNRLLKVIKLLGHYLRDPFQASKPVPLNAVVSLIRKMLIIDPINILTSYATPPKEYIYLSVLIPDVRQGAYELLQSVIWSVGSNIMTEASVVEELTLQELKWMAGRPNAFAKLKTGLFSFILSYLECTKNEANPKTVASWANWLINEIQIKRRSIELNQQSTTKSKNHSNRKGPYKVSGKTRFLSTALNSTGAEEILPSNSGVAALALKILGLLIPSLDAATHKIVHVALGRTAVAVVESDSFPSPYDDTSCRRALFGAIVSLVQNPHPLSPISLSFLATLLKKTEMDHLVAAEGHKMRSWLERMAHPIGPTLNFPTVLPPEEAIAEVEEIMEETISDMTDSFCQTDPEVAHEEASKAVSLPGVSNQSTPSNFNLHNLDHLIRLSVESAMQGVLKSKNVESRLDVEESEDDGHFISAVSSPPTPNPFPSETVRTAANGIVKRKFEDTVDTNTSKVLVNGHEDSIVLKRAKGSDAGVVQEGHLSYEAMLNDFVDL